MKTNLIIIVCIVAIYFIFGIFFPVMLTPICIVNFIEIELPYCGVLNEDSNEFENIGGGSIDLDPDLSPSYAYDFLFGWKSIFVFVPLVSGVITIILLSIHFILKKKHIRSRPYIAIISAAIMLYFGIQILSGLSTIVMFLQQESPWHYLDQIVTLLAYPIIGFSLIGLGIVFLYKSQLIRRLIKK